MIFAVLTNEFAQALCLPPRGRGTAEAVEGACAIKLYCKHHQEQLSMINHFERYNLLIYLRITH